MVLSVNALSVAHARFNGADARRDWDPNRASVASEKKIDIIRRISLFIYFK